MAASVDFLPSSKKLFVGYKMIELFKTHKDESVVCQKLNEEGIKAEDNKSQWDALMVLKFAGQEDNLRKFTLTEEQRRLMK